MICAYEQALSKRKTEEACRTIGNHFLAYIEAIAENTAHELFGFGAKRLEKMRNDTDLLLNEYMQRYYADGDDVWETTQSSAWGLRNRLEAVGFDMEKARQSLPINDRFSETWHSQKDIDKHIWRKQWIETNEEKMAVYWAVLLLYMNGEYGHAEIRLTRYYNAMRKKYNRFAELYLMCKESSDSEMSRMIEEEQAKVAARGVEFESV